MENNQQSFIKTIRQALGKTSPGSASDLFGPPPENRDEQLNAYLNKSVSERRDLLELFIEQANLAHISVTQVNTPLEAGLSIRELIQNSEPEWGDKKRVIAWHHPVIEQSDLEKRLSEDGVEFIVSRGSDKPDALERDEIRKKLIQSYVGITSADFCVAQSATLVMKTRPHQPRAVSLVPSIHIAVITADQIVESLKELYFRLKWDQEEQAQGIGNCMTFISGPSKTADIELQMVFGAHGPKQLHVYVITDVLTAPSHQ